MDNSPQLLYNVVLEEGIAASFQYKGGGVFHVNMFLEDSSHFLLSYPLPGGNERWDTCQLAGVLTSAVLSDERWLVIKQHYFCFMTKHPIFIYLLLILKNYFISAHGKCLPFFQLWQIRGSQALIWVYKKLETCALQKGRLL